MKYAEREEGGGRERSGLILHIFDRDKKNFVVFLFIASFKRFHDRSTKDSY